MQLLEWGMLAVVRCSQRGSLGLSWVLPSLSNSLNSSPIIDCYCMGGIPKVLEGFTAFFTAVGHRRHHSSEVVKGSWASFFRVSRFWLATFGGSVV